MNTEVMWKVVDLEKLIAQLLAQLGVEAREWLVEQQHLRLDDQRARQRDTLLLAARQFPGIAVAIRRQPHAVQHIVDLGGDLGFGSWRMRKPKATFWLTVRCGNNA